MLEVHEQRMNQNPTVMQLRKQTVEHPFDTIKSWMGMNHFKFKTKTLIRVSTEMSLHVLAYNLRRAINVLGTEKIMEQLQPA